MKIKHQLAVFNAITRLLLISVFVFVLQFMVEKIIYRHTDKILLEKKEKFIEHLNDKEINAFLNESGSLDTYASFSKLHGEFILLSKLGDTTLVQNSAFVNEARNIENQVEDYRILQFVFPYKNMNYQLEIGSSLSEIKELTFAMRFFSIVLLIVVSVVTFLAETFYIEYLLKPFYKIIDTKIKRVNEPNGFDYTPIKSHSTDFNELDAVLNQMMGRINNLFQQEKQFIGNVSHELLTPISLLKNRFENLMQNESLDETAVDKVASSLKTLDRVKKIINNLVLISRIDNNQYVLTEMISVKEIVENTLLELEDQILERNIEVNVTVHADFDFLGNKTLFHILIFNILSNAVKYNVYGGKIEIRDSKDNDNYRITISDTGEGIPEAKKQMIFHRFGRINQDIQGLGLGLAIAESIAKFHGITIEVQSQEGVGSSFAIVFPVQAKIRNKC